MFADRARIYVRSGKGGDGHVSFRREKYVPNGGPDGGDGGRGGDVIFVVDEGLNTLIDFRNIRKYKAGDGEPGNKKNCRGKDGQDITIKVPQGTVIKEAESGKVIADMSGDNREIVLLRGGRGGNGNQHYATSTMQAPKYAQPGQPAQELELLLELKVIADVGLVGFPNVGKSSLISVVSAAKPEIANYHFTTLSPVLGVVRVGEKSFVMADIPGLIEGASEGVGLGHAFLRHVERCRLIVHVVDVSGSEDRDPKEDFDKINLELSNFSRELALRPQIVAANKSDMASQEQIADFKAFIEEKGLPCFVISAATTAGTKELIEAVAAKLDTLPPMLKYEPQPLSQADLDAIEKEKHTFKVEMLDEGVYEVTGEFLLPILGTVNMEDYESIQYLQRVLRSSGIIDELEKQGVQEGDTVSIYDFEFDYVK